MVWLFVAVVALAVVGLLVSDVRAQRHRRVLRPVDLGRFLEQGRAKTKSALAKQEDKESDDDGSDERSPPPEVD